MPSGYYKTKQAANPVFLHFDSFRYRNFRKCNRNRDLSVCRENEKTGKWSAGFVNLFQPFEIKYGDHFAVKFNDTVFSEF